MSFRCDRSVHLPLTYATIAKASEIAAGIAPRPSDQVGAHRLLWEVPPKVESQPADEKTRAKYESRRENVREADERELSNNQRALKNAAPVFKNTEVSFEWSRRFQRDQEDP